MNFYKMNKKTILIGSAATLVLTGLAWRLIEDEILSLKSRAFINETAAARTQHPENKAGYAEISERLKRRANLYEIVQLANPWTFISSLRKLYNSYITRIYRGSGKF